MALGLEELIKMAQLASTIGKATQQAGQPGGAGPAGPMMMPGQVQPLPPMAGPPRIGTNMPGATGMPGAGGAGPIGEQAGGMGIGPSAYAPRPPSGGQPFDYGQNFQTKHARNAAVAGQAIESVMSAVTQFKQKQWDKRRQTSQALIQQYIALKQSDNPQLQQQADAMFQDKKFVKLIDQARKDPTSAEYIGITQGQQQALQASQQKAQTEAVLAELQARMQAEKARGSLYGAQQKEAEALTPKTPEERAVALKTAPTAGEKLTSETEIKKAEIQAKRTAAEPAYHVITTTPDGKSQVEAVDKNNRPLPPTELKGTPASMMPSTSYGTARVVMQDPNDPSKQIIASVPTTTTRVRGGLVSPTAQATKQAAAKGAKIIQDRTKGTPKGRATPEIKVLGTKGLNPNQYEKMREGLVAVDRTRDLMKTVLANGDVFESAWSAGKIALAISPSGFAAFSRSQDLSPQEEKVATAMQLLAEHINTMRGPLQATGFRGHEAFEILQMLHGKPLQRPGIIKGALTHSLETLDQLSKVKAHALGLDKESKDETTHKPGAQANLPEGKTGTGSDGKKYVVKGGVWVPQ
jgi:hypothetical protein